VKKKRLVHLISSLKRGGAESLLVDLLKHLDEYEHCVIYFHDGPNQKRIEEQGIQTYKVDGLICFYDPIFWFRLWRLIHVIKPDIIHSALWAANFAGRLLAWILNIPLVSVIHLGIHQDGICRNVIDTITFRFSKKVIAVSQEVADSLYTRSWISAEKISVIPNGIDVTEVKMQAKNFVLTRQEIGLKESDIVIGSVGRFVERKNFALLIHAFSHLAVKNESLQLILVGFGPLEENLRSLVNQFGISERVVFIVGKSAYSYYPLFDCFVLPSFQEGLSIALLEAMCFSLPCLATSPNRSHEVLEDGYNGLVAKSNDLDNLTEKLFLLTSDYNLRKKLGENAYQTMVKRFSIGRMASEYKQVLNQQS
jgi:glycosyltransferase involved in cell wall biosynthesis